MTKQNSEKEVIFRFLTVLGEYNREHFCPLISPRKHKETNNSKEYCVQILGNKSFNSLKYKPWLFLYVVYTPTTSRAWTGTQVASREMFQI